MLWSEPHVLVRDDGQECFSLVSRGRLATLCLLIGLGSLQMLRDTPHVRW